MPAQKPDGSEEQANYRNSYSARGKPSTKNPRCPRLVLFTLFGKSYAESGGKIGRKLTINALHKSAVDGPD
jgi:hypothetical protein